MANGLVAQYLLVVTLCWGQPGSHRATYIHRRYNPNNSCDYYKCVSKVGHSLAVTSSYLPTKQSSSAHITHLLFIGDPIHGRRRDKHLAKNNHELSITLDLTLELNGEGVFYKMLWSPTDSRVLCWSGANAAQVSTLWLKTTSLNT